MRADRHDQCAIDLPDRRKETFRTAERPSNGVETGHLNPGALLENLQLRKLRARDLQVQRAFVWFDPELLAELVLVPFLPHVERALAKATRDGRRDRHRFFDLENPPVVGGLFPEHFSAPRRESDPLAARREV